MACGDRPGVRTGDNGVFYAADDHSATIAWIAADTVNGRGALGGGNGAAKDGDSSTRRVCVGSRTTDAGSRSISGRGNIAPGDDDAPAGGTTIIPVAGADAWTIISGRYS